MSAPNVVKVHIFGQEYTIKTSANPDYIKRVAAYVNDKMEEIAASGIDVQSQQLRIAILASMNITDELFSDREKKKKLINTVEAKTLAISEFVENKIQEMESRD